MGGGVLNKSLRLNVCINCQTDQGYDVHRDIEIQGHNEQKS
jgi:hypothetical protein